MLKFRKLPTVKLAVDVCPSTSEGRVWNCIHIGHSESADRKNLIIKTSSKNMSVNCLTKNLSSTNDWTVVRVYNLERHLPWKY